MFYMSKASSEGFLLIPNPRETRASNQFDLKVEPRTEANPSMHNPTIAWTEIAVLQVLADNFSTNTGFTNLAIRN